MFSKGKVENKLLGRSRVKSQKGGEKLINGMEANFYKGHMSCESRWRLLVFWVPHIHWRRLRDKVKEILKDSATRSVRAQAVERATALRDLSTALVKLLKI